ncbi:MAG: hypothetical protein ACTHYM_09050 [Actinomycetaceae bacterium]
MSKHAAPPAVGATPMLGTAATALGLETDDLSEMLAHGSTLGEVAQAQGVDSSELVDALLADIETLLDDEVADGALSQDEADARISEIADHVDTLVTDGAPAAVGPPVGSPSALA